VSFQEAEQRYRWLEQELRSGRISRHDYQSALNEIRVVDTFGRTWMIQEGSGLWHVFDGRLWHLATPPVPPPASPAAQGSPPWAQRQTTPVGQRAVSSAATQQPPWTQRQQSPVVQPAAEGSVPRRRRKGLLVLGGMAAIIGVFICVLGGLYLLGSRDHTGSKDWTTTTLGSQGGTLRVEGLEIFFGPEALPADARVRGRVQATTADVVRVRSQAADEALWMIPVGPIYDVELLTSEPIGAFMQVIVPYDPELLGDRNPEALVGASWKGGGWARWPSEVDEAAHTVTFAVDGFSQVAALWDETRMVPLENPLQGPTPPDTTTRWFAHTSPSGRFAISYKKHGMDAVLRDAYGYVSIEHGGSNDPDTPLYIRDMGIYLDQAWGRIKDMNYRMPPEQEKIRVTVRNLNLWKELGELVELKPTGWVDGKTGVTGPIYIDSTLRETNGPRAVGEVYQRLKAVTAHELFHVVQRYNPSFPTWFYEASAVYLEWQLFGEEFPLMVGREYINPGAAFLTQGMWKGNAAHDYAKAALLIYLQDRYSHLCSDILLDGIYPLGGSSWGLYAHGVKLPNVSAALLGAARKCSGEAGLTWDELFAGFARAYYAEWNAWPTARHLFSDARGAFFRSHTPSTTGYKNEDFVWATQASTGQRVWVFPEFGWQNSSAALWEISGSSEMPASTLVLSLSEAGLAYGPQFWFYAFPYGYDLESREPRDPVGPTRLMANAPTVAIGPMGHLDAGGQFHKVQVVGVMGLASQFTLDVHGGRFPWPRLRTYFLPAPRDVQVQGSQAHPGELQVSWDIDQRWIPDGVRGLVYKVYASSDPSHPLQHEVATRQVGGRDQRASFVPPADTVLVSVVLTDGHGNQSPPAGKNIEALYEPEEIQVMEGERTDPQTVLIVALERLGYGYALLSDDSTQTEWKSADASLTEDFGILTRVEDNSGIIVAQFQNGHHPPRFPVGEEREVTRLAIYVGLAMESIEELHRTACAEDRSRHMYECEAHADYRGLSAITTHSLRAQDRRSTRHRAVNIVVGDVIIVGERVTTCLSANSGDEPCEPPAPSLLSREIDMILDQADRMGLIRVR
jgi:hypothetical protein